MRAGTPKTRAPGPVLPALLAAAVLAAAVPVSAQDVPPPSDPPETERVGAVLDDFHDAASKADSERYFGAFAEGAIFIGTDATERWTVEEFQAYAKPYFDRGRGWTYTKRERHVYIGPDGRTAWFDEILDNASFGETRGTGVLVKEGGDWKIAQYHLTIPIPNAVARRVVELIRAAGGGG